MDITQGDRVPADCILLEEMQITVDQGMYFENPNEALVSKETSEVYNNMEENDEPDNHKDNPDPFLFTDSKVMTGHGKAVVCAVGDNTL